MINERDIEAARKMADAEYEREGYKDFADSRLAIADALTFGAVLIAQTLARGLSRLEDAVNRVASAVDHKSS